MDLGEFFEVEDWTVIKRELCRLKPKEAPDDLSRLITAMKRYLKKAASDQIVGSVLVNEVYEILIAQLDNSQNTHLLVEYAVEAVAAATRDSEIQAWLKGMISKKILSFLHPGIDSESDRYVPSGELGEYLYQYMTDIVVYV